MTLPLQLASVPWGDCPCFLSTEVAGGPPCLSFHGPPRAFVVARPPLFYLPYLHFNLPCMMDRAVLF